jgi:hypothetical protein
MGASLKLWLAVIPSMNVNARKSSSIKKAVVGALLDM